MNKKDKIKYIKMNIASLTEKKLDKVCSIINKKKNPKQEKKARKNITNVSHLLYKKSYNVSLDGNISTRLNDKEILITPSRTHKGFIKSFELLVMDYSGNLLRGVGDVSSEYRLHTAIYKNCPDVNSIIHAHTPYATACSLAGIDLTNLYITQPPIPTTKFVHPSSPEVAEEVLKYISDYKAVILNRHGLVVWGLDIWEAFSGLEQVEHTSEIVLNAFSTGQLSPIDEESSKHLKELFKNLKK